MDVTNKTHMHFNCEPISLPYWDLREKFIGKRTKFQKNSKRILVQERFFHSSENPSKLQPILAKFNFHQFTWLVPSAGPRYLTSTSTCAIIVITLQRSLLAVSCSRKSIGNTFNEIISLSSESKHCNFLVHSSRIDAAYLKMSDVTSDIG